MDIICKIESNCDDNAKGSSGEIGRYQIRPIVLKHFNQVHEGKKSVTPRGEIDYVKQSESERTYKNFCAIYGPGPRIIGWSCDYEPNDLKDLKVNALIANWYMNWLYERCWTVEDTLIAWNWGIGNWKDWKNGNAGCEAYKLESGECAAHYGFETLPKTTQAYLKKYQELGGQL